MYIYEVGNLSVIESRAVDGYIRQTLKAIDNNIQMIKFSGDMIDQLDKLGQNSAVESYHAQLAAISKELIASFIYLGHCWTYFGDTFSSTEAYQSALKLDENNADVLTFIGRNYLQQAEYLKAKSYFEKARSIKPSDPMMLFYHAECCQELGQMRDAETSLLSILHSYSSAFETNADNGQLQSERWRKFAAFSIVRLRNVKIWKSAISIALNRVPSHDQLI
jgi:tetratricopeptide (TPR) repeat protein